MLKLYGIPNCNTVKKARNWLDTHNVVYVFHDYKKLGIDETTLQNWLAQQPWEKLINRAGQTWRGLSDEEKSAVVDNVSATRLMQAKTSAIKRPILANVSKIWCLGFDENLYKETFKL